MRGSLGLVIGTTIGLVVGSGAMYLALRPPWAGQGATGPSDAAVAVAPSDAGSAKKKPQPGRRPARPGKRDPATDPADDADPPPLTDADRRLEWRGDDVPTPDQKIDMSGASQGRRLDDSEINGTIDTQTGPLHDCVVKSAHADLRATIAVEMYVEGSGHVTRSRLQAPHYLFEHGLLACAQGAMRRLSFPATGAPTRVSFPIHLGGG